MRCAGCRKEIDGNYVSALDRNWHRNCFACAACGKPFQGSEFMVKGKKPYHEKCYAEKFNERCARCQNPIMGASVSAMGKHWHPEHFVCASCNIPFKKGKFIPKDGIPYCEKDYHILFTRKCDICGQPLVKAYLSDTWDHFFCTKHKKDLPNCFSCGRLICQAFTRGGVRYGDGRYMCNLCGESSVDNDKEAARLLQVVRKGLAKYGISTGREELPLRLVDQKELKKQGSKHSSKTPPSGRTLTNISLVNEKEVDRKISAVLALHGLPKIHLATILAHELGHCFLFLNHYPEMDQKTEEGFAELCSFLWLSGEKGEMVKRQIQGLEKNKVTVYRKGFLKARAAYQKHGLKKILKELKAKGRFP